MLISSSDYKDMKKHIEAQKQLIRAQDRLIEAQEKLAEAYKAKIALLEERNDLSTKMISDLVRIAKGADDE